MIINQRDAKWWFKLNGAARLAVVRGATNLFARPLVITEYPKSGGTWLSQMLSEALAIPYPRNRLPHLSSQVIHGCYLDVHRNIDTLVVWRDGRDVMVSFYYHLMFEKPITSTKFSQKVKKHLAVSDPYDIADKLPDFIEWTFNGGYPGYSWSDFVNNWNARENHHRTSYEAVTADPHRELRRAVDFLGGQDISDAQIAEVILKYSFENQASRARGEEDVKSFIRKGIVGDWKNVFDRNAREIFNHYAGRELVALGYEDNDDWVDDPKKSTAGIPA